jgi:hypothetical protein
MRIRQHGAHLVDALLATQRLCCRLQLQQAAETPGSNSK